MAQRPDAYGYHTPPEQQEQLDAVYKKASRIAARHSGGNEYVTIPQRSPYEDMHLSTVHLQHLPGGQGPTQNVGKVVWNTQTGHVSWLGVDNGHRHMVPKLLADAKAHSDAEGYAPPSSSGDMTGYSYKLAKRYAPEHIPEGAVVNYRPLSVKDSDFHKASEHINTLHALAMADAPGHAQEINRHFEDAHFHLDAARKVFRNVAPENDRNESYGYHISSAGGHVERLGKWVPDSMWQEHPAVTRAERHFASMDGYHPSDRD